MTRDQNLPGGGLPIRQELPRKNLASRPPVQVEHVDEAPTEVRGVVPDVRFRKTKTPRMSTTKLMSGKMARLMMIVTMPQQENVKIETKTDCSRM
jgi:hypothetical protein